MKKCLIMFLCIVLTLTLFPCSTLAAYAVRSPQNLTVDGETVSCDKYNIDGYNYFKLRDIAFLLNGTGSQFDVGWDSAANLVSITRNHVYTSPTGTELFVGEDYSYTAQVSPQSIKIDGVMQTDLKVYNIGGSNYFQLRELGTVLDFNVSYIQESNTAVIQSKQQQQKLPILDFLKKYTLSNGETNPDGTISAYFIEGAADIDHEGETDYLLCSTEYDKASDTVTLISFVTVESLTSSLIAQTSLQLTKNMDSYSGHAVMMYTTSSQKQSKAGNFIIYPKYYTYDATIDYIWEGQHTTNGFWDLLLKSGLNELGAHVLIPNGYSLPELGFTNLAQIEPWFLQ